MKDIFFLATQHGVDNLTEIFDLVHPILSSLWNMKAEIMGLKTLHPNLSETKLKTRFSISPEISGVNYTRAFLDWDWDKIRIDLAWIILNNIFVVYEGWLKELHNTVFTDTSGNLNINYMQFPLDSSSVQRYGQSPKNIIDEINRLKSNNSLMLKEAFYDLYRNRPRRATVPLNNLMFCYRYFKELRNCYTHNGKIASQNLVDAYNKFLPYATSAALGVKECPEYIIPICNTPINLSLRGVIGFSSIIFQIMLTCDAELLCSKYAEAEFLNRLHDASRPTRIVKSRTDGIGIARTYVQRAGYMKAQSSPLLFDFLLQNKFLSM